MVPKSGIASGDGWKTGGGSRELASVRCSSASGAVFEDQELLSFTLAPLSLVLSSLLPYLPSDSVRPCFICRCGKESTLELGVA